MGDKQGLGFNLFVLLLVACAGSETGNPASGDPGTPDGIAAIRSSLARDTEPSVPADQADAFGRDGRDFAFDLYAQAASGEGNRFLSPYSVQLALGMIYAGARGETRDELAAALHFTLPEPELHAAFNATDIALQGRDSQLAEPGSGDLVLKVVNGAFAQEGLDFKMPFLDTLAVHYDAGMFAADFANEAERERLSINQWVEDNTEGRVTELLPSGSVDSSTALVLANTIYFKGSWLETFDPALTADEDFQTSAAETVTARMMNGPASQYVSQDGYQAVELKYLAPAVRMLIILPDEGRFGEVEGMLDRPLFDSIRSALSEYEVELKMPRFAFDATFTVRPALQALGANRVFDDGMADLSGIAGDPGELHISGILHKAFVAVDEQGTEAAASTAVVGTTVSRVPPAEFYAVRPFIFVIHDVPTGQILFAGRVTDPTN